MNIDKTTSEVPKPSKETKLGFDPDRLMGSEPKGSESEVKSSEPGKLIDFDKLITRLTDRIDSKDLYSTRLERVRYTPVDGPNGSWVGERGESKADVSHEHLLYEHHPDIHIPIQYSEDSHGCKPCSG